MDGVNTYNCQCPPEWTGKTFPFIFIISLLYVKPIQLKLETFQKFSPEYHHLTNPS